MPSPDNPRIAKAETNPPPLPGHADALNPTPGKQKIVEEGRDVPADGYPVETQEEMLDKYPDKSNPSNRDIDEAWNHPNPSEGAQTQSSSSSQDVNRREASPHDPKDPGFVGDVPKSPLANTTSEDGDTEYWEPKPPKVLMDSKDKVPLELRSQIQQYAMTEYASLLPTTCFLYSDIWEPKATHTPIGISSAPGVIGKSTPIVHHSRRWRGFA
jgi:hypothetical protein